MIYKDTLFDTIPITAHSCIVEKELAVTDSARDWIGVEGASFFSPILLLGLRPPNPTTVLFRNEENKR